MTSKAVARAAERLDISKSLLAKVLGVSPPTITRLYSGNYLLDQGRKEWEFALLFVRDSAWCVALLTPQAFSKTKPRPLMQTWWLAVHQDAVTWRRDNESMTFS